VAAAAAAAAVVEARAETEPVGPARALVDARVQALLIAAVRLAIAVAALALARVRGLEPGPTAGLFALGCGLLLVTLPASVTRRRGRRRLAEAEPLPPGAAPLPPRRALALAMYPSTIGLTVLTVIALWPQPPLAAFLAGILAGLGVMALVGVARLWAWERARGSRFYVDAKSEQVFEALR